MSWSKLTSEEVTLHCDPKDFEFETTENVPSIEDIIGQERAVKAMDFGLRIKKLGYNIYISGLTGTGRNSYARSLIEDIASQEDVPDDWLYVYNFKNPEEPMALSLPPGKGAAFADEMDNFLEELKEAIPNAFDSEDYEKKKAEYVQEFQEKKSALMEELNRIASEKGFALKRTSSGFMTIPIVDGNQVSEEEYENLDPQLKEELEKKSNEVQMKAMEILRKIQTAEQELKEKIQQMDTRIALIAIGHLFEKLKDKYSDYPRIIEYLDDYQQDILKNIDTFRGGDEQQQQQNPLAWMHKQSKENIESRYRVNVVTDNSKTEGAPVIVEHNPSYYNLLGRIEHENRMGTVVTDFTMIKGGAFHQANGGYLILQARDVLTSLQSWEALKRVLKTKEIRIENIAEHYGLVAMSTLRPEPIPLDIKVVMIGSPLFYHLLYYYDEDFRKLFKVKADFDVEMKRENLNMSKMASFISTHCRKEDIRHFDRSAVARICDYGSRLAEHREKMSTRFNDIVEVLYEADAWAALEDKDLITSVDVDKAIEEKKYRSGKYEDKLQEMVENNQILLQLEGTMVGQINGLSVIDSGDYQFGRPNRITASTFLGRRGIVDIERESRLSGNIHNKGVLILSGFIGERYAQKEPLTLSASVCFEQSYGGIEGDSATVAELMAILSSFTDTPMKQGIAITGSINQKGEIQPVGGVNKKIEGFYRACKSKGLNGEHGVIIPQSNRDNLVLEQEVVDAVKSGNFSVYIATTVDDVIELLTDMLPGERNDDGTFPEGTFNYLVQEKLRLNNELFKSKRYGEEGEKEDTSSGDSGCQGSCS